MSSTENINKKPSAIRTHRTIISSLEKTLNNFMTYVRTRQLLAMSYRDSTENQAVHIPIKEIEGFFNDYKRLDHKTAFTILTEKKRLRIIKQTSKNGRTLFKYQSLEEGSIDMNMIPFRKDNFDNIVIKRIKDYLLDVSIIKNSPSTDYFNFFLKYKYMRPDLFFSVDNFSRRIHTPITNFHKEYRRNILLYGRETSSIDVVTMQPLLLGKILKEEIGKNEFSDWINSGIDIYNMLQQKAKLKNRNEAKKRFFEILFSPPSDKLVSVFGKSNWINWVNKYKKQIITQNPNNKKKPHSNLAWLLQKNEVKIMYSVWQALYRNSIPFLTVHDEIITEKRYYSEAKSLFEEVLSNNFEYFKLN